MRRASEHKIHGRVTRFRRRRGREVSIEHRPGNHLRLRVVMGDVAWSVTLRGFETDDPRIPALRAALERAAQTGDCDAAANQAVGRLGRGARCFAALRRARRRPALPSARRTGDPGVPEPDPP